MQMQALSTSSSPLPSSLGLVSSSSYSSTVGIPFSIRFKTSLSSYYIPLRTRWRNNLPSLPMAYINSTNNGGTAAAAATVAAPKWAQKTIIIPAQKRGCHLITSKILREIGQELSEIQCGLAHLFLQHTSASLTINENYDSDVRDDTETFLNKVVPEGGSAPWKHTLEGPDDMPAHIKSSMFGCSLMVPITDGKLNIGTWQGIWLCEHRDYATPRQIVVTLNGI